MNARLMILSAFAALPMLASAAAFTPAELDKAVASLPKANVMGGFAVHSKQFCGSCHGPNGIAPTANWPHVAGQPFEVTAKALLDYRDGRRTGGAQAAIMTAAAKRLTDQQIADVSALYEMLPGPDGKTFDVGKKGRTPVEGVDVARLVRKGNPARAITPCAACHGMTGKGRSNGKVPVLHGQNPTYLAAQLRDYRDGRRDNDVLKEMRFFAQKLTDDEINALADFYAGETGWPGVKPAKPAAKAAAK